MITSDEAEERGKKYDAEGRTYLFDLDFNLGKDTDGWDRDLSILLPILASLFYFFQNTSKPAHLLTQAVYTPNQYGVKVSEFFSEISRLATLF